MSDENQRADAERRRGEEATRDTRSEAERASDERSDRAAGTEVDSGVPSPEEIRRVGLSNALRDLTAPLHRRAERSGVISDIVRGRATREAYALLLRNLHPVYDALERGLERHRHDPAVQLMARPEVYRANAIAQDLVSLCGSDFAERVPLLPAGAHYAAAVEAAAEGDGVGLIGHAYTRYLGDLSGGQVVGRVLAQTLGLGSEARSLYEFATIVSLDSYKGRYRDALDRAAFETERCDVILSEAMRAFRLNIALFWAVHDAIASGSGEPSPAAAGG